MCLLSDRLEWHESDTRYFLIHMPCLNYKLASLRCLPMDEINREIH